MNELDLSAMWAELVDERALEWVRGALILVVGYFVARVAASAMRRLLESRGSAQAAMVGRRVTFYGLFFLAAAVALQHFGFDLTILLGAAGILTVAIGFASQTSASNLISGLFLLGERPFSVGDVIRVGTHVGSVLSIDLLSVKLRTFDNLLVRIPNEMLLKVELTNLTRFPIRRVDLQIPLAPSADLEEVREVLFEAAEGHPLCLQEPAPLFIVDGFREGAQHVQFSVWAPRQNFLPVKTEMQMGIKRALDEAGIDIAVPYRAIRFLDDQTEIGVGPVETEEPEGPAPRPS